MKIFKVFYNYIIMAGENIQVLKAEEVAKGIEKAVCKVLEKARWVGFVESENKVEVWGKKRFITALRYEDVEKVLDKPYSDVLDYIIEEVKKILEKYNLKEEEHYEIEIDEPLVKSFGSYGEFIREYVDVSFTEDIEFDKEYETEHVYIYYNYNIGVWGISINVLTQAYVKSDYEGDFLLTEEEIKELGLNPNDFEAYFEED